MKGSLVSSERIPLSGTLKQKFIDASGNAFFWDITILGLRGEGGSCLCYDVEVNKGPMNCQRMILKQFYPELAGANEISASLEGAELKIPYLEQRPDIQRMADRFEEAFLLQNKLASELDCIVKPSVNYFQGMTKLALYEANTGMSLDRFMEAEPENLLEMLEAIAETAESLHQVHEAGYLHMDVKPENVLWNNGRAKLFDFDAAINRGDRTSVEVIAHDGRSERAQTLAPELRTQGDKRPFLTPKVDIYSLGCILFAYIMKYYPTDQECFEPKTFKDAFHNALHDTYDATFELRHQEELHKIVSKCIHFERPERYETAKEMADALKSLSKKIRAYQKRRYQQADNNILSAYVLDEFPAYKYKYKEGDYYHIDIALVGNAEIQDAFLRNVFSCVQMIDTKLSIRVYRQGAEAYLKQLVEVCPQLVDTAYLYLNQDENRYLDIPLNQRITKEPLAYLYFYENSLEKDTLMKCMCPTTSYFVVADSSVKKNKMIARELIGYLEQGEGKRSFVGYGRRGNGGYSVETDLKSSRKNIHVQAFCCDANMTKREKLFKTEIYQKALAIHTFYTKNWAEKMEKQQIKADFEQRDGQGNFYNLKSSLRSALSISYKYDACGIPMNLDNAKVFYEKVVMQNTPKSKELYEKVMYLEHQSWMCFFIMEGYRCPTDHELEQYFFRDGNDHRNKKKKLHPCICGSYFDVKKNLKNLSHAQWNSNAVNQDMAYDELDRMSLKLHRLAEERSQSLNLSKDFQELEMQLKQSGINEEPLLLFDDFYNAYERMLSAEKEINIVWERAYAQLQLRIKELQLLEAEDTLKRIYNQMKVVKERNLYHNYKLSDATIIDAIPRIMLGEKGIYRRIYKTPSKNIGDMIISVTLMEPDELVLLCEDNPADYDSKKTVICAFLKEHGLSHVKVTIERLSEINLKRRSKKSVLDITGSDERFMMRMFASGFFAGIPVIRCENGKMIPEVNADDVRYYVQPKHLTVEETFSLFQAKVVSDSRSNYMWSLNNIYKQLWQAYIEINDNATWKKLADYFAVADRQNYKKVPKKGRDQELVDCETSVIYTPLIAMSGMDCVLEELCTLGYIEAFQLPNNGILEGRILLKCDARVGKIISEMVNCVRKEVNCKFSLVKREGALFLYSNILSVQCEVAAQDEKKVCHALTILQTRGSVNRQECIIQKIDDKDFITEDNGKKMLTCRFASRAVKECLLKAGNVLETFAYNTFLQQCHFHNIQANVTFRWNMDKEYSVENEVDLVCTKGMQTFFVSCKLSKAESVFLTEIKYLADHYGINAKVILLCANTSNSGKELYQSHEAIWERSQEMDVYYVNRSLLGDNEDDIHNGKLAKVINAIAGGKQEWWNV